MRQSPLARLLLGASAIHFAAYLCPAQTQQPPTQQQVPPQQPAKPQTQQPAPQQTPQSPQAKKPAVGPAAPQSTHYPILLLVQGNDQSWSLRIGLRGPERLDRNGYPPVPLEPADVAREGSTDSWTYHAKDSQTGAAVSVRITREPCTDPASTAKFAFTASMEHAQIGAAGGCARVATELFPKINNQPTDDDDDAKDKPAPPTITHFKPPVAVAYVNAAGKLIVKRGTVARAVPEKADTSHLSRMMESGCSTRLMKRARKRAPKKGTSARFPFTTGEPASPPSCLGVPSSRPFGRRTTRALRS